MPLKRTRGKLGQASERLLGQRIAEVIGVGRSQLRIQKVEDERVRRRVLLPREAVDQQRRRADVNRHVGRELGGVEFAEPVPRKARRTVDEKPDGRQPGGRSEDGLRAICVLEVGNRFRGGPRNIVRLAVDLGDHLPAVVEKGRRDRPSDALAGTSDDCGPRGRRHRGGEVTEQSGARKSGLLRCARND